MKQHKRMKDIEGTSFFEEFEAYRESIMKQLLQTKEQIDVHEKSEELLLIKKLAILELSEKQWRELNQKPVYFFGLWDQMKAHRAFYHNAEKRDAVFSEQLQKLFEGKSLFTSSIHTEKEAIVFVSGGFHSKGLTQHLKEKNISYLLMTPSIQGMPDEVQQMCIENSQAFMGLFATHPPIEARIRAISEMTGTVAVMTGASRRYDGPMGKSDRAFVFGILAIAIGLGLPPQPWLFWLFPALGLMLAITIVNRVRRGLEEIAS